MQKTKLPPQNIKYWMSPSSWEYETVAEDLLLTDIPAYELSYFLLEPQGNVLDLGCLLGRSTKRIVDFEKRLRKKSKINKVIGADINPESIRIAQHKYHAESKLQFITIESGKPLKLPAGIKHFDAAILTFVHPTIESIAILEATIKNVAKILVPGGRMVMLGLNPNSFNPEYSFINYSHNIKHQNNLKDGQTFINILKKDDGATIYLHDFYWQTATLVNAMENSGLDAHAVDPTYDMPGRTGAFLRDSIKKLHSEKGIDLSNRDEFNAPLHQIIVGIKE